MLPRVATLLLACFVASLLGTEVVRRIALARAWLDKINERSLHTAPTPRLGGVAIVVTVAAAALASWGEGSPKLHALVIACVAIALLGLTDDLRPVSASLRLAIQLALSVAFVLYVGVPPLLLARGVPLPFPSALVTVLLVVWIVGVLNIYNFMDGMDGLAGSQAVFAFAALAVVLPTTTGAATFALASAAAALGFLAHNAPPARIFMGDAGSTFLGLALGGLAVLGLHDGVPIGETALPLAPFLLDGTFTILRRASRKERIWTAHRSHLYQRAVQTGLGHRDVLLVYLAWIAVSTLAAVVAAGSAAALACAWGIAVAGFFGVWRWVTGRESKIASAA